MEEKEKKKIKTIEDIPGIGSATIEKLRNGGYRDLFSLAFATTDELMGVAELSETTAKKVIALARANIDVEFESGEELLKRREKVQKIKSGSSELDKLLNGGFETNAITEVFGAFGSGKTNIAHTLAVRVQLPYEKGGLNGGAVYIDTEGTFRPERIIQIAKALNLKPEEALKNIKVARALNSDHQMLITERIEDLIKKGFPVKLVIVDSLTAHFRAEYVGRGTLADRQQKINKHMHQLMRLAENYNLAVYVTNQVMAKPDVFFGDPTEAIGGHIVGHNSSYRIYLRRGKKGTRIAKMVDAPNIPEMEVVFAISDEGITDAK